MPLDGQDSSNNDPHAHAFRSCTTTTPSRVAPPLPQPTIPDNHQLGAAAAAAPGLCPLGILIHTLSLHPSHVLLDLIDYSLFIYRVAATGSSSGSGSRSGCQLPGCRWFWLGFGRWVTGWLVGGWYGARRFLFFFFSSHRDGRGPVLSLVLPRGGTSLEMGWDGRGRDGLIDLGGEPHGREGPWGVVKGMGSMSCRNCCVDGARGDDERTQFKSILHLPDGDAVVDVMP